MLWEKISFNNTKVRNNPAKTIRTEILTTDSILKCWSISRDCIKGDVVRGIKN